MKKSVRRLLSSLLVVGVTASIVVASIAPLLTPPISVAQTNPQTTDIFTGQFIPAYYGAAYDPSEAYKHMAGTTVYVFAYDTWGAVVNNFAYETQVRADGSFQAAGLPNASHYGVYFPYFANRTSSYFRVPRPEDNLQSTFAYQQADFPTDTTPPNTQINGEKVVAELQGSSVFLTSSRSVDIGNHTNIFPLVPTNVLSVIIKDSSSNPDYANINKPYEIYAQRVATKALKPGQELCDLGTPDCQPDPPKSYRTNGPVIRGRTIYYTPTDPETGSCGQATIFQVFAPAGTYAITYWRPDGRDAQNQITYLNYNGTQPLNTNYNGIAVEVSESEPPLNDNTPVTTWGKLSNRCVDDDDSSGDQSYWDAYPNSANIWGVLYQGEDDTGTIASSVASVSISGGSLNFVDPESRKCSADGSNSGDVKKLGIYIFSTCRNESESFTSKLSVSLADNGSGSPLQNAGGNTGSALAGLVQTNSDIDVSVNSHEGPSRKDVAITLFASQGANGQLLLGGKPIRDTWLSMEVDGHIFNRVAKTDANGYFVIGANYFHHRGNSDYRVFVHSTSGKDSYQSFTIDSTTLARFSNGKLKLGAIALDKTPNQMSQFLASLDLTKFFEKLRIQPAMAAYEDQADATWSLDGDLVANEEWVFYLDTSTLFGQQSAFTPSNYSLRHADIKIPPGFEAFRNCMRSENDDGGYGTPQCTAQNDEAEEASGVDFYDFAFNMDYNLFERNTSTAENADGPANTEGAKYGKGIVTPSGSSNEQIIAVALQPNSDDEEYVDDYLRYFLTLLGPDPVQFNLRAKFVYTPQSNSEVDDGSEDYNTANGQEEVSRPPAVLTAEWPVFIQADGDGYKVTYEPVTLVPTGGDICIDASWNDPTEWVEEFMCKAVLGGISGIKSVFDFLADYILIIDPLSFGTVTHFWNMIRNIINSMVIFILVAAGVAIMFRYEPSIFNIRSVITKLIVAVVLVNFSILIVQVAVDVTNVIAYGGYRFLLNSISQEPVGGSGLAAATASLGALGVTALGAMIAMTGGVGAFVGIMLFVGAIILFFGYIILRIGIDYALRVAVLWICIILAPVAFASRIMPGTQKYFGRWKGILLGTLVAQITVAFMIALAIGMLKIGIGEGGFWNSLLTLLLAFALFYYTTKAPRIVAGMVGEDLSAGLEGMAKKGLASGKDIFGKQLKSNERRRAQRELREARKERGEYEGWRKEKGKSLMGGLRRFTTGNTLEDYDKERDAVFTDGAREHRRDRERDLRDKGLLQAEAEDRFDEEDEKIELRMIGAKTGFSKSKFELYRSLADTGQNLDYSVGGKVDFGGADWDDWKGKFTSEDNDFYKRLGGNTQGSVAQTYLTALENAKDNGIDISNEEELTGVIEGMYGNTAGLMEALQEQTGMTFKQLQGPHGAKGLLVGGVIDAATKVDPSLNTDYNAMKGKLARNQYDRTEFNANANRQPAQTGPVHGPAIPPGVGPNATAQAGGANAAGGGGGGNAAPQATGLTPPANLPANTNMNQLNGIIATYNQLAGQAMLTPNQQTQLNNLRATLQNQYGYQ